MGYGGEIISENIKQRDIQFVPGTLILEDADGTREMLFAATSDEQIVGPGSINPQDAQKLLAQAGGYLEVTYGDITKNEYLDDLRDRDGMVRFYKMMDDDAVQYAYNTIIGAVRGIPYYIQYASEDPVDLEAAAFVSDQLGIESSKAGKYTFQRLIRSFEHSLIYGIGYSEIVMKLVDGKAVLDTIIPYHPLTVDKINKDSKGGPKSITVKGKFDGGDKELEKDIPIQKTMVFINEDDGDMKGRSILRAAYAPYHVKRTMLRLINAGFERYLLGIPVFKAPKGVLKGSSEWNIAKEAGLRFAGNPKAGLTLPAEWEFDIVSVNSQMPDALPYVNMMNDAIMRSMGIEYGSLGKHGNGSGGYGQSNNLVQLSERSIRTMIDNFVQYINTYLIPKIMVLNYPDVKNYPMLTYSEFDREISQSALQFLQQLITLTMDLKSNETKLQVQDKITEAAKYDSDIQLQIAQLQAENKLQTADLAAKSAATRQNTVATNSEVDFAQTPVNVQSAATPLEETGAWDTSTFNAILADMPSRLLEQLGFAEDRRKRLLSQYRSSQSSGYRPRTV